MKRNHAMLASIVLLGSLAGCREGAREKAVDRSQAKPVEVDRMAWWRDARLGMFIHWGLYSIPAGEWNGSTEHAEWIMTTAQIPVESYEQFVPRFDPRDFDADAWALAAAEAGMKYVVITSKHHDGFALFDSKVSEYDVMATPFGRDILRELADAVRRHGMVMCWYHSIMDWHHPDYLPRRDWESRSAEGADFERYRGYLHAQVEELLTQYGHIGVMWFDGEWEPTWTNEYGKQLYALCRRLQPDVIVNNRVSTGRAGMAGMTRGAEFPGDFGTPEQEIPAEGLPGVDWETCMTMNDHWGFNAHDRNWKSSEDLIRKLCDIASKGGNFLLNVGPTAAGRFPQASLERLREIGAWMKLYGESIHGTQASPLGALSFGRCTQKSSADGKRTTLYLQVFDWPLDGVLHVDGLAQLPREARLLADGRTVKVRADDGRLAIEVGAPLRLGPVPVIALEFDAPLRVHRAPTLECATPRFVDVALVALRAEPGQELRYTLDGRAVDSRSARAESELRIGQSATLRVRAFEQGAAKGPEARLELVKVTPRRALTFVPAQDGLLRERFAGEFERLPDFATLTPDASTLVQGPTLPDGPREERVAYVWRGAFEVPEDGMLRFDLTSDDGARLFIDGALTVDNDGLHAAQTRSGDEALAAGWHSLRLEWFNRTGGAELELRATRPDRDGEAIVLRLRH